MPSNIKMKSIQEPWFRLHDEKLSAPITPTTNNAVPAPTKLGTYKYHAFSISSLPLTSSKKISSSFFCRRLRLIVSCSEYFTSSPEHTLSGAEG